MSLTIADQFIQVIVSPGVNRVYGVGGDSLNGVTDAISRQGSIELLRADLRPRICCRAR